MRRYNSSRVDAKKKQRGNVIIAMCAIQCRIQSPRSYDASRGKRKRNYPFLRKDCNKVGKRKRQVTPKRLSIVQPGFDLDGRE